MKRLLQRWISRLYLRYVIKPMAESQGLSEDEAWTLEIDFVPDHVMQAQVQSWGEVDLHGRKLH